MYSLTNVTRLYEKGRHVVPAVRDVTLEIPDGDWLAIQGRTGHGKSTLLQLLGGLDRPTSGTVALDGQNLGHLHETQVTRLRATDIGFVFQTFNLVPTLTAADNVEAALIPLGPAGRSGAAAPPKHSTASVSPTGPGTCRRSCRAASSSGSRSPGHWSSSRRCFSPTSRPATSTRTPARTSWRCWRSCGASTA